MTHILNTNGVGTELNINDYCWVILNSEGERIWAEHWNRFTDYGGVVPKVIRDSHVEPDGRTRFQIHELAYIFGPFLYNGSRKLPFKDNRIWF